MNLGGVVFTLLLTNSETRVPVTEVTSNTSRSRLSGFTSFHTDVLVSVEVTVRISITSSRVSTMKESTTSTALVGSVVEDAQRRKSDTFSITEEVA